MVAIQWHIHKGSPIIPIMSRINPVPRIDTYFFKIHSNIILSFGLEVYFLKFRITPIFYHSGYMHSPSYLYIPRIYHSEYIRWKIQTIKFLISEASPLPISSLFGSYFRLRNLLSNILNKIYPNGLKMEFVQFLFVAEI